jgi:hypothetical protein
VLRLKSQPGDRQQPGQVRLRIVHRPRSQVQPTPAHRRSIGQGRIENRVAPGFSPASFFLSVSSRLPWVQSKGAQRRISVKFFALAVIPSPARNPSGISKRIVLGLLFSLSFRTRSRVLCGNGGEESAVVSPSPSSKPARRGGRSPRTAAKYLPSPFCPWASFRAQRGIPPAFFRVGAPAFRPVKRASQNGASAPVRPLRGSCPALTPPRT